MKPRRLPKKDFLSCLIATAYLPEEMPPVLKTQAFSDFCKANYLKLEPELQRLRKLNTTFETYTVPRTVEGRRNLAIVNPLAQLGLSLALTLNKKAVGDIIFDNKGSLYSVESDRENRKAFSGLQFDQREELERKVLAVSDYVLKADISRFFYTIYTHSITWAILGKEKTKDLLANDRQALGRHWSTTIDMCLQACQSRETFGVPVGPDTSRIVAELILAEVEKDSGYAQLVDARPATRLLDDFLIGFENESHAVQALGALRNALWKFNLQLNEEKTRVARSKSIHRERWKLEFEKAYISDNNPERQGRDIDHLVELTLHLCEEAKTDAPASWASRRISEQDIYQENIPMVLDSLFRLSRDFPSCLHHVAAFLINRRSICIHPEFRKSIIQWLRQTLNRQVSLGHDSEVAWCLLVGGFMNYKFRKVDLPRFGSPPNAVIFAIMGLMREKNLLPFSLDKWNWRTAFKNAGIFSENWLPMYEAVRRGWTKDKGIIAAVRAEPIFASMLKQNVTFLDDLIFSSALASEGSETYKIEQRSVFEQLAIELKVFQDTLVEFNFEGYDDPDADTDEDYLF